MFELYWQADRPLGVPDPLAVDPAVTEMPPSGEPELVELLRPAGDMGSPRDCPPPFVDPPAVGDGVP